MATPFPCVESWVSVSTARGADPFAETEDQTALRELAREVGRRAVAPHAGEADATGELSKVALQALADADLFRVTIGEQWGGLGLGDVEAAIVLEEIARHDISTAICCQLAFNGPSRGIEHLGGEALKDRWLPQVADGEAIVSIGITEPDAGSAVQNMRSALVADGDGRWRLNGYKNYSTLGHVAKGILVWCRWPGGERVEGHRSGGGPHGPGRRGGHRPSPGHGHPRRHRGGGGLRRRGHRGGRHPHRRRPRHHRRLQGPARPPQPRAVRQRRHVHRGGPGGPGARRPVHERPGGRRSARSPTSRGCGGSWPTWPPSWRGPACS